MKKFIFCFFLIVFSKINSNGQVLISLVFGDQINSGTVEFGLEGGANFATIDGLDGNAEALFNLGFYFDIKTKNPKWLVHTGVMVKASLGAHGLPVYTLNDPGLDSSFAGGEVQRKINYFNVPLMMKYKTNKRLSVMGGIMPSLRYTANDIFTNDVDDNELEYRKDIADQLNRIDFGLMGGVTYRLMGGNGMNLSAQYYYGLTDITKASLGHYNRSVYFTLGIPIGAGKAKEREKEKQKEN